MGVSDGQLKAMPSLFTQFHPDLAFVSAQGFSPDHFKPSIASLEVHNLAFTYIMMQPCLCTPSTISGGQLKMVVSHLDKLVSDLLMHSQSLSIWSSYP